MPDRVSGGVSIRMLGADEVGIGWGVGAGGAAHGLRGLGLWLGGREDDAVAAAAGFDVPFRPTQYRIN